MSRRDTTFEITKIDDGNFHHQLQVVLVDGHVGRQHLLSTPFHKWYRYNSSLDCFRFAPTFEGRERYLAFE